MVLEYLQGHTLRHILQGAVTMDTAHTPNGGAQSAAVALPPRRAVQLVVPIIRALAWLGIIEIATSQRAHYPLERTVEATG